MTVFNNNVVLQPGTMVVLLERSATLAGDPNSSAGNANSLHFIYPVKKVMAKNLMALEGNHNTVAVVGSAHLDGMEDILSANGWVVTAEITAGRRRLKEP